MIVEKASFANFRRIKEGNFSFSPGFNLLVGKNGSGKTSILDSIYLASTGKSFITNHTVNCIQFNEEFFFVSVEFKERDLIDTVDYLFGNRESGHKSTERERGLQRIKRVKFKKELKLSGKKVKGFSEIIGKFPVLFLNYALVDLVTGSPEERREFINHTLIFLDRNYYKELIRYYSLLERRNSYLKENAPSKMLINTLSEQMIDVGERIIEKRTITLEKIEKTASEISADVLGEKGKIEIRYEPSKLANLTNASLVDEEIKKKRTLFGIHLDDINVLFNGNEAREFSSLGEAYSIGFAFKFAESQLIFKETGKSPVLLLDDFFTDLDEIRREKILSLVKNEQAIITSTSLNVIPTNIVDESKVIML